MQRYESYKPSAIPWIDALPQHWGEEKGKWLHRFRKDLNNRKQCDNVLSLTLRGVVNNNPDDPEGLVPKDYGTYQIFEKDDLVFKLIDLENFRTSRVGLVHERGIMSSAYLRVQPGKEHNPRYFYYYYFTLYQQGIYNKLGAGVRSTLGATDLLEIGVPMPSKDEQDRIVAFLDQKTAEIDAAIAKKERLIELLEEQKRVLINRAVTQGLDHRVGVKKSGITWLGEVPAHWRLLPNKALFRERKELGKPDLPILSVSLHSGVSDQEQDETENIRAKIRIEDKTSYKRVFPGDVAYNMMRAWQGAIGVVRVDGQVSPAYVVAAPRAEIHGAYFEHLYRTEGFIREMDRFSKGITDFRKRLYWDEFKQLMTLLPPISEQIEIAEFVERIGQKTAQASASALAEIEKLRELRRVLVAQTVTGQVRV